MRRRILQAEKTSVIPGKILKEIPPEFRNFNKNLMLNGILHYNLELDDAHDKFILKLYKDIDGGRRFSLSKELLGYKLAIRAEIPIPKIYKVSYNPPYLLMEKKEGPNLKSFLLDDKINFSLKVKLVKELCCYITNLANIRGKKIDSRVYFSNMLNNLKRLTEGINIIKLKKELAVVESTFCSLRKRTRYFKGNFYSCAVHGDLNPFNIIIDPSLQKIGAILDWEKGHFGHPLEDIGLILRRPLFGFSEILRAEYEKKIGKLRQNQLDFFKDFFNLEFVIHYLVKHKDYSIFSNKKRNFYKELFQNHLKNLENI